MSTTDPDRGPSRSASGPSVGREALPITVVIPAYQNREFVEQAVRSALEQSQRPDEIIVVDDGSTDGTTDHLSSLALPLTLLHQANAGPGAARNVGLQRARNPWVALLDADDWWLPEHLSTLWAHRDGHVLVSTTAVSDDGSRLFGNPGRAPRPLQLVRDTVWPEVASAPSATMVRRDLALELGGFTDRRQAEDVELWMRLIARGSGLSLPSVTCVYRQHAGQATSQRGAAWAGLTDMLAGPAVAGLVDPELLARVEAKVAWDRLRALQMTHQWTALLRQMPVLLGPLLRVKALAELLRWRRTEREGSRAHSSSCGAPEPPPGSPG